MNDKLARADRQALLGVPAFRRWFAGVIQISGMFDATASEGDGRNLYMEGRRSLALDLLRGLDAVQPEQSASGIPVRTLIQILGEEAQSPANKETAVATGNGVYDELDE